MDTARFQAYLDVFNAGDFEGCYDRFWTPDVVLKGAAVEAHGRDVVRFLARTRLTVHETLQPRVLAFAEGHILAEMDIVFTAQTDSPDFFLRPVRAGERLPVKYMVSYTLAGDRMSYIKTFRWPVGYGFPAEG